MDRRHWLLSIDPAFVERRLGHDVVLRALASSRAYTEAPALEGGRLGATVIDGTPFKTAVRVDPDDVLDVSCACRQPRICAHVTWLLVDVAFDDALREAIVSGRPREELETLSRGLPDLRRRALELRTLDDRIASWLPTRKRDDDFEIDVEVALLPASGEERAAIFLRHRRRSSPRGLVPARDVLASRLPARHRDLVDLTAPFHGGKDVLVATRGQASYLARLLKDEIGVYTNGFRARIRYADAAVSPKVEREDDRLVARWTNASGERVADAESSLLVAGPCPYLFVSRTHTFHPVSPSVDLDAALGMHRVPSLPLDGESEQRVGRAILARGRGLGVALPAPETFGLPPPDRPTFELRLHGTPLEVHAELVGDGRDPDAEERARAALLDAGFALGERGLVAAEERAVLLWTEGLAKLRASEDPRFDVVLAASIHATKIGPPVTLDIRVTGTPGWLDTELEFRSGALGVEITRMHEALAANRRWVALSDGTLARIGLRVAELIGRLDLDGPRLKLPRHQLGRVARWLELADGVAARVSIDDRVLARPGAPALPARLEATLRPYQAAGLAWMQLLREVGAGGLLADDMGLGKTLMTLAFLARWREDAGPRPSLVVCPTSVVGNWLREAARFTPGLRATALTGEGRRAIALEDADLVVTTYGVLRRDLDRLVKTRFRAVVLDEAQNVKNATAVTSIAARRLDAETRLALTGTPVENRLGELWSLMTFCNPGILGTAREFDARYERPIELRPDGAVAAELRAVVRPFILRRTKAGVLPELPPKTEVERHVVFGLRQKKLYDALALASRQALRRDLDKRKNARTQLTSLTAILRLRQMACDPRLVDPEVSPGDSAKRVAFLDLVRELVSEDRRALVFSQFVELLSLWRVDLDRAKVPYEWLDGRTKGRDAVVERFQTGRAPLFLISLRAGGAGLNLTAADTVIHCDPWWNPAAEDQATDRAHRIGQDRPVTVVRLLARGTIEEKVAQLKEKKRELAGVIADPGALEDLLGDVEGDVDDGDDEA